ncbi:hypothetical protein GCM10027075_67670 [Streptomyces heilongjiangensis]
MLSRRRRQEGLWQADNPGDPVPCYLRRLSRWPAGGRTPLGDVKRGSTDQPAAHALIRQNVTQ